MIGITFKKENTVQHVQCNTIVCLGHGF